MRVEILTNLKGESIWKKGTVFDDTVSPIPRDIMTEMAQGAKTVRVLPGPKVEPEVKVTDLALAPGMREIRENFSIPEGTPEVLAEEPVEAEPENESFIIKEAPTKHLPELEGLIHAKGTIAAVSNLLGVSYAAIGRWRKGGNPKPDILQKIKKEYAKLTGPKDDQDRTDDVVRAGIEGSVFQPER